MKKFIAAAVAMTILGTAGMATAQPMRQDQRETRQEVRQEARQDQWERKAAKRYNAGRYQAPRGYKAQRWAKGQRLPAAYRTRAYVVDYRRYKLKAPPRGYHYVRVGNDVVLTAIATGVIASVIVSLFN
jgi:Ni/Co efflux regulator RcnB